MRATVYCHRPSTSAQTLRHALRLLGVQARRARGILKVNPDVPLVNWGCSDVKNGGTKVPIINSPGAVRTALSKRQTLRRLAEAEIPCVEISTELKDAQLWISRGRKVLMRKDGLSGGKGIEEFNGDGKGLGTKYDFFSKVFPKTHEFRVHVVGGIVVDIVQKKASSEAAKVDRVVRTHSNGWIYAHDGLILSDQKDIDSIGKLAKDAIKTLELDFGAVDILAIVLEGTPRRLRNAVICEVNTAPGLENTKTIQEYARGIRNLIHARKTPIEYGYRDPMQGYSLKKKRKSKY